MASGEGPVGGFVVSKSGKRQREEEFRVSVLQERVSVLEQENDRLHQLLYKFPNVGFMQALQLANIKGQFARFYDQTVFTTIDQFHHLKNSFTAFDIYGVLPKTTADFCFFMTDVERENVIDIMVKAFTEKSGTQRSSYRDYFEKYSITVEVDHNRNGRMKEAKRVAACRLRWKNSLTALFDSTVKIVFEGRAAAAAAAAAATAAAAAATAAASAAPGVD